MCLVWPWTVNLQTQTDTEHLFLPISAIFEEMLMQPTLFWRGSHGPLNYLQMFFIQLVTL